MRGKFAATFAPVFVRPSFNEARALCAGSPSTHHRKTAHYTSFNEARALCAGSSPKG